MNQLAPMGRIKDRDDEATVRPVTKAVAETEWPLNAQPYEPAEPSLNILANELYTSLCRLGTNHVQAKTKSNETSGVFRKSLWKEKTEKEKSLNYHVKDIFVTEFIDALFANQRRWGQDPRSIKGGKGRSHRQYSKRLRFNFERPGYTLLRCSYTQDEPRISRKLTRRKNRNGMVRVPNAINIANSMR